jgi:hypothetical protein
MTTKLSGFGLMWTGHGIAWSRSPQPTLRNPAGRAEAASGCAASALASATTCGGTEASACLAAVIDDPAPPGDANPTSGTTVNTTQTATLRRTKPPLSESHSPAEETRASNTSIIRMQAWLFPSRRHPPLLNPGAEREDVHTDQLLLRRSFVNTGAGQTATTSSNRSVCLSHLGPAI